MQNNPVPKKANPLANYMRQPKIYIKLPSMGNYWPMGSIVMPDTGELPVYSMTAKDELMFKTPDALLNGQSVVTVVESCVPNIKNAWDIPALDLDTILIAIRLATYGDKMSFEHAVPNTSDKMEYELDLRVLIDQLQNAQWIEQIAINPDFIIYVRPLNYRSLTQTSIKTFETQRIFNLVNDDNLTDEQKVELFNQSFSKLTKLTVDLVADSVYKIETLDQIVTDPVYITEFMNNSDREIFEKVQNHLKELKNLNDLKPLEIFSTPEQQELGAPEKYSVPLNFNESDFFGKGF
jgi:hypothetical protein